MTTSPPSTKPRIVRVAVATPLRRLFDYTLPIDLAFAPVRGARVIVPFGSRTLFGVIIELDVRSELAIEQLKPIQQILDQQALFSENLLEVFIWASQYYQYPLGMLFDTAIPKWLRTNKIVSTIDCRGGLPCPPVQAPLTLNAAQQAAINSVSKSFDQFKIFLLDGVTGSGKTEVYMQLIEQMIKQQKQTLVLVPEINLTPQTLQRFEQRFQVPIAMLHSQVSEKQRALAWLQAQSGQALIILGTRLAAFTPLQNPGLFIIDEEHDLSFKQQDHLRYSARDLLLKRAQIEQVPVVLGSATPSLESWHNAQTGKYTQLILPERAGTAQKPTLELIDTRHKQLEAGLSNQLLKEIGQQLAANNQVLLFLNRRGFAPVLMCHSCGWHQICKRCDCNMILHDQLRIVRCHHCNAQHKTPSKCPNCNDIGLGALGIGTQRLEACIAQHFPQAHILRVDRDTVRTKKQLQATLDDINNGKANILIGTQMLAKGHHFTNLTLVAIIDIDAALFSADFRATERIGQLITQVSGRTGRGDKPGKVLLQTTFPDHPLLQTLIHHSYHEFLQQLIQERQHTNLPPYSYQVLLRAETKTPAIASQFLNSVKDLLITKQANINCLGPIPAPMEKRQGFYRAQLLLQANNRKILQQRLTAVISQIENNKLSNKVRWAVDVDPLEMF